MEKGFSIMRQKRRFPYNFSNWTDLLYNIIQNNSLMRGFTPSPHLIFRSIYINNQLPLASLPLQVLSRLGVSHE